MALITTWLNNRGQNKRQAQQLAHDVEQRTRQLQHDVEQRKAQLEHDSEQRRTDREMSLRREVYLEAAAATGKLQEFIASYARQDISENDKLMMVQGSTATLNKIHIVGTNRTIKAFSAAQLEFAKASVRLGRIKLGIVKKTIDIEQLQRDLRLTEENREGILQIARNLGPSPNAEAVESLSSKLTEIDVALNEVSSDLDAAQEKLFKLQMALVQESVASSLVIVDSFSGAALAVREELRLGIDADDYREFLNNHGAQLRKEMGAFVAYASEQAGDGAE